MITKADLEQFTGTSQWHKGLFGMLYTDGVKYLADNASCYWLLDAITSYQGEPKINSEDFQRWILKKVGTDALLMAEGRRQYYIVAIRTLGG